MFVRPMLASLVRISLSVILSSGMSSNLNCKSVRELVYLLASRRGNEITRFQVAKTR